MAESTQHNTISLGLKVLLIGKDNLPHIRIKRLEGEGNMYLILSRGKVCAPYWVSDCSFILPEFRNFGNLCGISPECENELMLALILLM